MQRSRARPVLFVCTAALGIALAWRLGEQRAQQAATENEATLVAAIESAGAEIARLTDERDMAQAQTVSLQQRLSETIRLTANERSELELYRRISNTSRPVGLSVDGVRYTDAGRLDVTIVQSRGRERVRGEIGISLMRDGQTLRVIDFAPDGKPLRFDLRFFDTVSFPLTLADIGEPQSVVIRVRPESELHDDFTFERAWNLIAQ